jgi:hypothetical protein
VSKPNDKPDPVVVAKTMVSVALSVRGMRSYRMQVVEGTTQAEVDRLIALALAAERKLATAYLGKKKALTAEVGIPLEELAGPGA